MISAYDITEFVRTAYRPVAYCEPSTSPWILLTKRGSPSNMECLDRNIHNYQANTIQLTFATNDCACACHRLYCCILYVNGNAKRLFLLLNETEFRYKVFRHKALFILNLRISLKNGKSQLDLKLLRASGTACKRLNKSLLQVDICVCF